MSDNRVDSANIQSEIIKEALTEVVPPVILEQKEIRFWKAIINARLSWTEIDLIHAANLARCQCAIEEETIKLKLEGSVIQNNRGTPVMNPRHTVLEQLTRRAVVLSSKLHIHALATQGEAKLARKKNNLKQQTLEALSGEDDDEDLIAKPLH